LRHFARSSTRKFVAFALRNRTTNKCSVKLPKSFVAIDLSEKVPDAFERRGNGKAKENVDFEANERGRSEERKDDATRTVETKAEIQQDSDLTPVALPPPALDA
jgi:inositol hexakisphosphate/diphosphoinositol-pentakisphosphate kinase